MHTRKTPSFPSALVLLAVGAVVASRSYLPAASAFRPYMTRDLLRQSQAVLRNVLNLAGAGRNGEGFALPEALRQVDEALDDR